MLARRTRVRPRTIVYRYLSYDYEGEPIRLPIISVRLRAQSGNSLKTTALVDSGATVSFVPPELLEILDVPLGEASSALGAGGEFKTHLVTLTIEILKGVECHEYGMRSPRSHGAGQGAICCSRKGLDFPGVRHHL